MILHLLRLRQTLAPPILHTGGGRISPGTRRHTGGGWRSYSCLRQSRGRKRCKIYISRTYLGTFYKFIFCAYIRTIAAFGTSSKLKKIIYWAYIRTISVFEIYTSCESTDCRLPRPCTPEVGGSPPAHACGGRILPSAILESQTL